MAQQFQRVIQEDLNIGTGDVWVAAPGGGKLRSIQAGIHTVARGQVAYEATWAPGAIAAGAAANTTVAVPDAALGDIVMVSHDKVLTRPLRGTGHVSASEVVTVELHNPTGASVTVASGTVRVLVFPFIGVNTDPPAQVGNITGTVYENGSPVEAGLAVTIVALALATTTDGNGEYGFTAVPAGAVTVHAERDAQNFDDGSDTVVDGQTVVIDLAWGAN